MEICEKKNTFEDQNFIIIEWQHILSKLTLKLVLIHHNWIPITKWVINVNHDSLRVQQILLKPHHQTFTKLTLNTAATLSRELLSLGRGDT